VVDDEYIVRTQLLYLLKRSGYDVWAVGSGEEALRALDVGKYQVLLTDWQMPNMDGLALCRHVRLGRQTGNIYVIMLTVRYTEEDLQSGLAAGVDEYVIKGSPNDEILSKLHFARDFVRSDVPRRKVSRDRPLDSSESPIYDVSR
jgi:sigma-B regulation protein RsbU (phosphoserine phosphatase)